nr:spike glycoprotein [Grimso virus]
MDVKGCCLQAPYYILFILPIGLLAFDSDPVGDVYCQAVSNATNVNFQNLTFTLDVSKGLGTYYILDKGYINTTTIFSGFYPVDGSIIYNKLFVGRVGAPLYDFNDGVFVKLKNALVVDNHMSIHHIPALLFGTTFLNNTYTVVIEHVHDKIKASVCRRNICVHPVASCYYTSFPNHQDRIYVGAPEKGDCVLEREFSFHSPSPYLYFHFYQDGTTFYAFYGDDEGATHFMFEAYIGVPLLKYYVTPIDCELVEVGHSFVGVIPLEFRKYMLSFDRHGDVIQAVDCFSSYKAEIQCSLLDFEPNTGIYELGSSVSEPTKCIYRSKSNLPDCDLDSYLNDTKVSSPINWERRVFSNCLFNLSRVLELFQSRLECFNIDVDKILGTCFDSILVDRFALPRRRREDVVHQKGPLFDYNYAVSSSDMRCQLLYDMDSIGSIFTENPSVWNNKLGFFFRPNELTHGTAVYSSGCYSVDENFCPCRGGNHGYTGVVLASKGCPIGTNINQRQVTVDPGQHCPGFGVKPGACTDIKYRDYMGSRLYAQANCSCGLYAWENVVYDTCMTNGTCSIYANIIFNHFGSGSTCVNDKQPDTEIFTGECVSYNIYGVKGQGVFTEAHIYTKFKSWEDFLYDQSGNVYAFKDSHNAKSYYIRSCYNGKVTAAFHESADKPAVLYRNLKCDHVSKYNVHREPLINQFDTHLGCVSNAQNSNHSFVKRCALALGDGFCVDYRHDRNKRSLGNINYHFTGFQPVVYDQTNSSFTSIGGFYALQIPTNFTIGQTTEFIQTSAPKISIDCAAFVCGDYADCRRQLVEYGSFCNNIELVLHESNQLLDQLMLQLANTLTQGIKQPSSHNIKDLSNVDGVNFKSVVGSDGLNGGPQSRSAIEDLLFNKVSVSDIGFQEAYNNCTGGMEVRDLLCTQTYNGLKVLPPVLSNSQIAGYTAGAAFGTVFGTPFALSVQYRINALGVTMNVLSDNQKMIANAFNHALGAIQNGFDATNAALQKIQDVVNQNANALASLLHQLENKFGAISSSLQEIYNRLDHLESAVQIDRLINGRLTALSAFVAKELSDLALVKTSAYKAFDKINECVKGHSLRYNFCGQGNHIVSFVQNAPYGMYFMHFTYEPTEYITANITPGLCLPDGTGIAPKVGYFVFNDGKWFYTGANYYYLEELSQHNTIFVSTCLINYTRVDNLTLSFTNPQLPDFQKELDKWFVNKTSIAPRFDVDFSKINVSFLDLNDEIKDLKEAIKTLNNSYINLRKVGVYEYYEKWPWYIWLVISIAFVFVLLLVFFICCCTGCGATCFKKAGGCCDGGHQELIIKTSHED